MPAEMPPERVAELLARYDSDDPATCYAAADELCDDAVTVPLARAYLAEHAARVKAERERDGAHEIMQVSARVLDAAMPPVEHDPEALAAWHRRERQIPESVLFHAFMLLRGMSGGIRGEQPYWVASTVDEAGQRWDMICQRSGEDTPQARALLRAAERDEARAAERAAVVRWLRHCASACPDEHILTIEASVAADIIERGEHLEVPDAG